MQVSCGNGTKLNPSARSDENLCPKGEGSVFAIKPRAFEMEPDFVTFEDRNAGALGDEEWPQCIAECGTVGVIGKEAIR